MKKKKIMRNLIGGLHLSVVYLGSEPNITGESKALDKLICRIEKDEGFDIDANLLFAPDGQMVHLIAEQLEVIEAVGCGAPSRWRVIRVIRHGASTFYAVKASEWQNHPALPGLDLSSWEVDLVYSLCEQISLSQAFKESRFDFSRFMDRLIYKNVQKAAALGCLDENQLISLLQVDQIALHALEAALLTCVWGIFDAEELPAFAMNLVTRKNAKNEEVKAMVQHFAAVDMLCPPEACCGGPLTIRLEAVKDIGKLASLFGRLTLCQAGTSDVRQSLIAMMREAAGRRAMSMPEQNLVPVFPVIVGTVLWPADVAVNIVVPDSVHVLTDAEADTLRLAAARMFERRWILANTLRDQLDNLRRDPRSYRMGMIDMWTKGVQRTMALMLFHDPACRLEAGRLFGEQVDMELEVLRTRVQKVEEGIDFLLSPNRYADAILDAKPKDEETYSATVAFKYRWKGKQVIAINKKLLPSLLMRVGVTADLVDDVINGLKDRAVIEHASEVINVGNGSKRMLLIPVEKLQNYGITAVTGDNEEDEDE